MHLSYFPQWQKSLNINWPFAIPCWMANPLHSIVIEHRVLFIHTPTDLPENVGSAIVNEIAIFNRIKTLLYSQYLNNVSVVKNLMEQLAKVENLIQINLRLSKDFNRFADSVKAIEKAPLYIKDKQMGVDELVYDIQKTMSEPEKKPYRIIVIDDLLSLKGLVLNNEVNRNESQHLKDSLIQLVGKYNISIVAMSRKPLKEIFSDRNIQNAYVTIEGKEYIIDTIISKR